MPHASIVRPVDGSATQPFVRLLGRRADGFVEFVFSIGNPTLGVELILPEAAYVEFCTEHDVRFVTAEQAAANDTDAWKWRFGRAGITE